MGKSRIAKMTKRRQKLMFALKNALSEIYLLEYSPKNYLQWIMDIFGRKQQINDGCAKLKNMELFGRICWHSYLINVNQNGGNISEYNTKINVKFPGTPADWGLEEKGGLWGRWQVPFNQISHQSDGGNGINDGKGIWIG
jgi:hypothetical protein